MEYFREFKEYINEIFKRDFEYKETESSAEINKKSPLNSLDTGVLEIENHRLNLPPKKISMYSKTIGF